mgnify:CR=1 FL=1
MAVVSVQQALSGAVAPGSEVTIRGWVRTNRASSALNFVNVSDGSCFDPIQVVAAEALAKSMEGSQGLSERDLSKRIKQLEKEMLEAAKALEFEKAARLRDQLSILKEQAFGAVVHDQVIPIQAGRKA